MTDAQREERAIWKLEQAGYRVRHAAGRYIVTTLERADELDDLASLIDYAEDIYAAHWAGRRLTLSA
jgi:hypothetical protein